MFILKFFSFCKDLMALKNPVISAGIYMVGLGFGGRTVVFLSGVFTLKEDVPLIKSIEMVATSQDMWLNITAMFLCILGGALVWRGTTNIVKDVKPIYIRGLPGQRQEFPIELLTGPDKLKDMGANHFGVVSEEPSEILENILDDKKAIRKHVLHSGARKIYLAGIARVPALVAYGTAFSNAHAEIVLTEHNHKTTRWERLDKLTAEHKLLRLKGLDEICPNSAGQIGLAIGFSTDIFEKSLPVEFQGHTFHYSIHGKTERNALESSVDLIAAVNEIVSDIEELRSKATEFHFFISAQTSVALELGRRYQTGVHPTWVVHNFDGKSQSYTWKIKLSGDDIVLAA